MCCLVQGKLTFLSRRMFLRTKPWGCAHLGTVAGSSFHSQKRLRLHLNHCSIVVKSVPKYYKGNSCPRNIYFFFRGESLLLVALVIRAGHSDRCLSQVPKCSQHLFGPEQWLGERPDNARLIWQGFRVKIKRRLKFNKLRGDNLFTLFPLVLSWAAHLLSYTCCRTLWAPLWSHLILERERTI